MRFKTLVVLSLALLMLVTLAAPALAKPYKQELYKLIITPLEPVEATGQYTKHLTHDGTYKFTVVLRRATPNTQYIVRLNGSGTWFDKEPIIYTNAKGNGRFSSHTSWTFTSGTIDVYRESPSLDNKAYSSSPPPP